MKKKLKKGSALALALVLTPALVMAPVLTLTTTLRRACLPLPVWLPKKA